MSRKPTAGFISRTIDRLDEASTDEINRKGNRITDRTRKILKGLSLASFILAASAIQFAQVSDMNVWAGSQSSSKSTKVAGDAERGRAIFNGKGVCSYCHGIDGNRDQRPQLAPDTAALIAQLNPKPADLRNPKSLRLTTDKARAKAIREGHPGTGMFPDTRMTDQELANTIAYLSSLRREGSLKGPSQ